MVLVEDHWLLFMDDHDESISRSQLLSEFFLENLIIYCTSTFAQSYQALTNNSPNKGQLQDIKNFHFLSSPPKKGWLVSLSSFSPWTLQSSFLPTYLPPAKFQRWAPLTTPWPNRRGHRRVCFYSSFTPKQLLVGRGHLLVAIPCLWHVSTWMLTSQQMILRRMTTTNLFVVILMFRTSKFQMNKDWDILLLHFLFSNYWSGSVKECWWCWVPHLFCGN